MVFVDSDIAISFFMRVDTHVIGVIFAAVYNTGHFITINIIKAS